ncbi:hypothetical protein AVEN_150923-1 [Araneus ventricosus]|uniref:Uncharacterized protein n=1 Tax=Araneus ventricosus TaxID=182803 RepID=A0A4Y2C8J8_ARAVE|nr:hypothetical protein AVEN_150923-1 [Araneus ventricosus]
MSLLHLFSRWTFPYPVRPLPQSSNAIIKIPSLIGTSKHRSFNVSPYLQTTLTVILSSTRYGPFNGYLKSLFKFHPGTKGKDLRKIKNNGLVVTLESASDSEILKSEITDNDVLNSKVVIRNPGKRHPSAVFHDIPQVIKEEELQFLQAYSMESIKILYAHPTKLQTGDSYIWSQGRVVA